LRKNLAIALICLGALAGCSNLSQREQRALSGGALGAAGGAVIGAVTGSWAVGALVGAAGGAAVGAITSK
jgi:osmotically inducible lipoprotein OsmB